MDLHQHLPEHAYHWIEDETHQSSTWSSTIGIWCVSNRTDLGKWYISGPRGVRAELLFDTAETQVIALLRLLGAINPAPEPLQPNESDWEKIAATLSEAVIGWAERRGQEWSGDIQIVINHRDAVLEFMIYEKGSWHIEPSEPLDLTNPDGPATGLRSTHSPETPHEASGGQSEHQDASETPPEASKAEVVDPQQIQIRFDGDAPTGQRVADLLQRIIDTRSQPARAIPMPIVLSDAEADHLLSDIEAAALLQEASKIVPTAAAAYGATTEWCERIEGWTERYKTWIENRGGNSSAAGETTPPETGTKLDRGTRSCPRLKPHDRHNWTTTDRTRPEPAENLWHCPGIADRLPLQCATTDGHAAHEWMSRGAMLWCTGNPRKETP